MGNGIELGVAHFNVLPIRRHREMAEAEILPRLKLPDHTGAARHTRMKLKHRSEIPAAPMLRIRPDRHRPKLRQPRQPLLRLRMKLRGRCIHIATELRLQRRQLRHDRSIQRIERPLAGNAISIVENGLPKRCAETLPRPVHNRVPAQPDVLAPSVVLGRGGCGQKDKGCKKIMGLHETLPLAHAPAWLRQILGSSLASSKLLGAV